MVVKGNKERTTDLEDVDDFVGDSHDPDDGDDEPHEAPRHLCPRFLPTFRKHHHERTRDYARNRNKSQQQAFLLRAQPGKKHRSAEYGSEKHLRRHEILIELEFFAEVDLGGLGLFLFGCQQPLDASAFLLEVYQATLGDVYLAGEGKLLFCCAWSARSDVHR